MSDVICVSGHHSVGNLEANATAALKTRGLRLTTARRMALRILSHARGPLTVDEIHRQIACDRSGPDADLVTIYRMMMKFEESGIVIRCDFNDGQGRYELAAADHHHHHIVCRSCKKTKAIDACKIDRTQYLPVDHGFTDITHRLEFFGICPDCR